jgi:GT2 family glycosyltransferase
VSSKFWRLHVTANHQITPFVSVIVLGWGGEPYISMCLESLSNQTYPAYEIIVVDNASPDRTAEIVERDFPHVRLIRTEENLGVAGGNNVGLRAAKGDMLILTNVDTEARPDWIELLVEAFETDPTIGVAGSKLLYPDGTVQYGGGKLDPVQAIPLHVDRQAADRPDDITIRDTDFATGASLAIRREVLDQIGLEDEAYFPIDYEDPDLCYRARMVGWRVCYVPQAVSVHHESSTFEGVSPRRFICHQAGRIRFVCKFWSDGQLRNAFLARESEFLQSFKLHPTIMEPIYFKTLLDIENLAEWRERLELSDRKTSRQTLFYVLNELRAVCLSVSQSSLPRVPSDTLEAIFVMLQQWLYDQQSLSDGDDLLLRSVLVSSSTQPHVNPHVPIAWPDWPPGIWPKVKAALQKITRRLLRWYIDPLVEQQNQINVDTMRILNTMAQEMFLLREAWAVEKQSLRTEIEDLRAKLQNTEVESGSNSTLDL